MHWECRKRSPRHALFTYIPYFYVWLKQDRENWNVKCNQNTECSGITKNNFITKPWNEFLSPLFSSIVHICMFDLVILTEKNNVIKTLNAVETPKAGPKPFVTKTMKRVFVTDIFTYSVYETRRVKHKCKRNQNAESPECRGERRKRDPNILSWNHETSVCQLVSPTVHIMFD